MRRELSRLYSMAFAERAVRLQPRSRLMLPIKIDMLLIALVVLLSFSLRLAHPLHPSLQAAGFWFCLQWC